MSGKARRRSVARKAAAKKKVLTGLFGSAGNVASLLKLAMGVDQALPGTEGTTFSMYSMSPPSSDISALEYSEIYHSVLDQLKAEEALRCVDADPEVHRLRLILNLDRMWPCSSGSF